MAGIKQGKKIMGKKRIKEITGGKAIMGIKKIKRRQSLI
jgi:hypothetical protein